MSEDSKIRLLVAEDQQTVDIGFKGAPDEGWYIATFKTLALDDLLGHLGLVRTTLKPGVSPDWDTGQSVGCYRNPAWRMEIEHLAGEAVLHLRDDRYGWLHYVIDKAEAAKLAAFLAAVAWAPAPETAGSA